MKTIAKIAGIVGISLASLGSNDVVGQTIENCKNKKSIYLTSEKKYVDDLEKEIKTQIEYIVNGNKCKATSIKTLYLNGYLRSAFIKYCTDKDCNDQDLQILFVNSDEHYYSDRQKEINQRLKKIINSNKYDIQDIKTVALDDRLVAAEIYYKK